MGPEVRRKVVDRLKEARNMGLCEEGRTELAYRPKTREWSISMYLHT